MKTIKIESLILIVMLLFLFISATNIYGQVGITFSLGNSAITNDGSFDYYEFDIIAQATGNSQFKLAQVYIDYNTAGFGNSIFTSGNVTATAGELLNGTFQGVPPNFGVGSYTITLNDNSPSKLSVANDFSYIAQGTYTGMGYELSNLLGTTTKIYARIKIKVQDPNQMSGISLDETVNQFELQQFYYTTPGTDDQVNYTQVNVGIGLNEPLPVELTTFSATYKNSTIMLNWITKTEVNNYGFNVERRINESAWTALTFVPGNGNSNSPKEYSYTDKELFAGGSKFQYRLKQMDNDGSFEYSDVVEVEVVPNEYELSQNYPNPFNPSTTIRISLPQSTQVKINLYNMLGEQVITIADRMFESGYHEVTFNASNLSSGTYIYRLESSDFVQVKKMILLK